jgi:hypothetical protein
MDFKVLLKLGIVTGVLLNSLDVIVQGVLMAGMYTAPIFRKPEEEIVYLVLTDFAAAFVFVWVYLRLGSATGPGSPAAPRSDSTQESFTRFRCFTPCTKARPGYLAGVNLWVALRKLGS